MSQSGPEVMVETPVVTMGRRAASRRALLGLGKGEAAEVLGVSPFWYGQIEADHVMPSLKLLQRMARLYGVTETWLLRGAEEAAVSA